MFDSSQLDIFQMNFVAAHCQRSKDLWLRMLTECEQRQSNDLITRCYNNRKSIVLFNKKIIFIDMRFDLRG